MSTDSFRKLLENVIEHTTPFRISFTYNDDAEDSIEWIRDLLSALSVTSVGKSFHYKDRMEILIHEDAGGVHVTLTNIDEIVK